MDNLFTLLIFVLPLAGFFAVAGAVAELMGLED